MKRKGHPRIDIKTAEDYNFICDDMISEFMQDMRPESGMTREPTQEDIENFDGYEIGFMYTQKAMRLLDRYTRRLGDLGKKYFPEEDIHIECGAVITP